MSGDVLNAEWDAEGAVSGISDWCLELETLRSDVASMCPGSRALSMAITKIDEARMWLASERDWLVENMVRDGQGGDPSNATVEEPK
ncbi:MAG TPA: hypothetical protein ENI79_04725 [Rhodospirillales bacterium]|nr:hypothetical protein [Rhodospirillales bacterium]